MAPPVSIVAIVPVVAVVLVVAFLPVGMMPTAVTLEPLLVVLRWGLGLARVTLTCWRRKLGRRSRLGGSRVRRPLATHRRRRGRIIHRSIDRLHMCCGFRRLTFVGVAIWADFRVGVSGLPSWTRTAAPATGAATFVHVVGRVLGSVCFKRLEVRRTSSMRPVRSRVDARFARARTPTARDDSDTVWNGNDRAFSHDGSGVTAWRGVRTRYRRRSSR
jgi:hypothetical protein